MDFTTTAGTDENMLIAIGHARLLMNQSSAGVNAETISNESAITIKVVQGSLLGVMTPLLAGAALLAAFSF